MAELYLIVILFWSQENEAQHLPTLPSWLEIWNTSSNSTIDVLHFLCITSPAFRIHGFLILVLLSLIEKLEVKYQMSICVFFFFCSSPKGISRAFHGPWPFLQDLVLFRNSLSWNNSSFQCPSFAFMTGRIHFTYLSVLYLSLSETSLIQQYLLY